MYFFYKDIWRKLLVNFGRLIYIHYCSFVIFIYVVQNICIFPLSFRKAPKNLYLKKFYRSQKLTSHAANSG